MNFLKETENYLSECGKTWEDIEWIGVAGYGYITMDEFKKLADIEYDSGYGSQKIAKDLLIVGSDWYLERKEYDGAESWEFKTLPNKPRERLHLNSLGGDEHIKMEDKVKQALDLIASYGGIDGAHHKQWVLDQTVRILTDCPTVRLKALDSRGMPYEYDSLSKSAEYIQWVEEHDSGEEGPNTYEWDEGIAP